MGAPRFADGAVLCRCGHPRDWHLQERGRGVTLCLYYHTRCMCARFTEAPFAAQQIALFGDTVATREGAPAMKIGART